MRFSILFGYAKIEYMRLKYEALVRDFKVCDLVMFFCIQHLVIIFCEPFAEMNIVRITTKAGAIDMELLSDLDQNLLGTDE